jgi:hypothetical protein
MAHVRQDIRGALGSIRSQHQNARIDANASLTSGLASEATGVVEEKGQLLARYREANQQMTAYVPARAVLYRSTNVVMWRAGKTLNCWVLTTEWRGKSVCCRTAKFKPNGCCEHSQKKTKNPRYVRRPQHLHSHYLCTRACSGFTCNWRIVCNRKSIT